MTNNKTMRGFFMDIFGEWSEIVTDLFLSITSFGLFYVGVEEIPNLDTIKIVVQNPNNPKTFWDLTEKILSVFALISSSAVSVFTFVRFVKMTIKKTKE